MHNINDFCVYVWCIYKYYIFIHMNIIYYAIISTEKTPLKIFQSPFFLPNRGEKIKHPYKVGPKPIRYQWSYGTLIHGLKNGVKSFHPYKWSYFTLLTTGFWVYLAGIFPLGTSTVDQKRMALHLWNVFPKSLTFKNIQGTTQNGDMEPLINGLKNG